MAMACSLQLTYGRPFQQTDSSCSEVNCGFHKFRVANDHFVTPTIGQRHGTRNLKFSKRLKMSTFALRGSFAVITCGSPISTGDPKQLIPLSLKSVSSLLSRVCKTLETGPPLVKCTPSALIAAFAIWGLESLLQFIRHSIFRHSASNWKKSRTYYIMASYIRPIMVWSSALLLCRVFDPVTLSTETSQVIKQRVITFVRSLSTVMLIAYCTSSLVKQAYKLAMEQSDAQDTRNMGYNFVSNAIYTAVWMAAVSLFMELLGFSTQKLLTAGGLGTLLLTLAGREIFTNFLSSVMIHAVAPFHLNEWIQTRIDGCDIKGHVERIGWWSPTIIRGDDREAIYIPNHKFTMRVVRNLTQKTHWRIKSHIFISHQDVHKISNIVADMRKVIAKNPQLEQQRLHRRVFFDNIDPENQSLRILVSCFVKTSHFEEYLCVKEAILLDLLRVISHHRARLATPIRTIQKVYGDIDTQNIPFEENITGQTVTRHLFLVESPRMPGEDEARQRARDKDDSKVVTLEAKAVKSQVTLEAKAVKSQVPSQRDDTKQQNPGVKESKDNPKQRKEKARDTVVADMAAKSGVSSPSSTKGAADGTDSSNQKKQLEGMDSMGLNSNDITFLKAAYEKPPIDILEPSVEVTALNRENNGKESNGNSMKRSEKPVSINKENKSSSDALKTERKHHVESYKSGTERLKGFKTESVSQLEADKGQAKVQEQFSGASSKSDGNLSSSALTTLRASLDENIVLGVAIDGPKRTLPIEEDIHQEQKESTPASKDSNEPKDFTASSKNSNANSGSK